MGTRLKYITFSILTAVTIWLRLVNLGYSDYQGDEIKALFLPTVGQGLMKFIFAQRKGPIQFFITYLINPNRKKLYLYFYYNLMNLFPISLKTHFQRRYF